MRRSYDLASALKTLIVLLEKNDGQSVTPYCSEDTEMLKGLHTMIPRPEQHADTQEYLNALASFCHAYSVVLEKCNLEKEDRDTILYFHDKLSREIQILRNLAQ
jgi:hypothetical protein